VSYLARLKADDSEKCLPRQLTKPTEAPSVSSVSAPSRHISEIGARVPPPNPDAEARRQRVLAMFQESPSIRYAVVVDDPNTNPVILALGVRWLPMDGSIVTCQFTAAWTAAAAPAPRAAARSGTAAAPCAPGARGSSR